MTQDMVPLRVKRISIFNKLRKRGILMLVRDYCFIKCAVVHHSKIYAYKSAVRVPDDNKLIISGIGNLLQDIRNCSVSPIFAFPYLTTIFMYFGPDVRAQFGIKIIECVMQAKCTENPIHCRRASTSRHPKSNKLFLLIDQG